MLCCVRALLVNPSGAQLYACVGGPHAGSSWAFSARSHLHYFEIRYESEHLFEFLDLLALDLLPPITLLLLIDLLGQVHQLGQLDVALASIDSAKVALAYPRPW